jgi:shikimate kinase
MNRHIFIIGMMGSGKSTIAPLLSDKLKIPYVDIDQDLMEILSLNIEEIFNYSEKKFRFLESTYFLEHIKNSPTIYATGGGIVLDKKTRGVLKNIGYTVLLKASVSILNDRVNTDNTKRPLLKNKSTLEKLWNQRKKYYMDCSDVVINTENKSPQVITNEIIEKMN